MEWDLTPRPASESEVVLVQHMDVGDANISGNVHGGVVMKLVDTAAGLAAHKHCRDRVVTVAMDEMSFLEPVPRVRGARPGGQAASRAARERGDGDPGAAATRGEGAAGEPAGPQGRDPGRARIRGVGVGNDAE